jgi:hypothetical protein
MRRTGFWEKALMADEQQEPPRGNRLPSYPLTVGAFTALLVFSFVMAAINAGW